MALPPMLDPEKLRAAFGPKSDRAKACGERVSKRRRELKFSQQALAEYAGTTLQTVFRIERGEIVPRDYLRAAIAYALFTEIEELWPAPSREVLHNEVAA